MTKFSIEPMTHEPIERGDEKAKGKSKKAKVKNGVILVCGF